MLAKIAVCAVVYAFGCEALTGSPLPMAIVRGDACVDRIVGSWTGEPVNATGGGLHELRVKTSNKGLHVFIRLFAQFNAPEYHVFLGPAAESFMDTHGWPPKGEIR
jgi:hypothetical protein